MNVKRTSANLPLNAYVIKSDWSLHAYKALSMLLEVYVFCNTKGSRIARILLCLKHDLQPELGSGFPGRWRPGPTLPRSRVTRRTIIM